MKFMKTSFRRRLQTATASIAVLAQLAGATGTIYAQTASSGSVRPGEPVTLNFNNAEIDAEVRTYLAIFQDEEHLERQQVMRIAAAEVMRELDAFRPYLTGAVLEGTAGRYAEVEIDLFPESAKEVEIFFLNHGVAYEHREPRRNQPDAPEAILVFDWGDVPVKLRIYSPDVERLSRRSPHGARQMERARLATVEALIEQGPTAALDPHS